MTPAAEPFFNFIYALAQIVLIGAVVGFIAAWIYVKGRK